MWGAAWTTGAPIVPQIAFQLRCEEELPPVGESFAVEILLKVAAQGIQRYDLIFHIDELGEGNLTARIESVESRTIRPDHFQVVHQTDSSSWFKALDVENVIRAGATDVVIAVITLRALLPSRTLGAKLEIPQALLDDTNQEVDPTEILILPASCGSQ